MNQPMMNQLMMNQPTLTRLRSCSQVSALKVVAVGFVLSVIGAALFCESQAISGFAAGQVDWQKVHQASQVSWPKGQDSVTWRADLKKAFAEAKANNRPLFVTLRCLPCKQCASFDKNVLEGGPALDPVLKQFITVRLTSMSEIDQRLFHFDQFQDLDLSWWGYFFSPEGRIYGVYGGKDHISDATRISEKSLIATLKRVLNHHYHKDRKSWGIDGPLPQSGGKEIFPSRIKGYQSWFNESHNEVKSQTCLHCHQVNDILRQERIDKKKFDLKTDFYVWPYPENLGLVLERDHGLRVKSVRKGSGAAKAGLKRDDEIVSAQQRRVHSQADFRGVLHRLDKGQKSFEIRWMRSGKLLTKTIKLQGNWRKSNLSWRKSVAEAHVGSHTGIPWPLKANSGLRKRYKIGANKMAIKPYWAGKVKKYAAVKKGLKASDVIIAVNGESPNLAGRAFNAWFRQKFPAKSQVTYTVVGKNGKRRKIKIRTERFGH